MFKRLGRGYRAISQFHENETLVAWLQRQRFIVFFAPKQRRSLLFAGALVAGLVGILSRGGRWSEYAVPQFWIAPLIAYGVLLFFLFGLFRLSVNFQRMPRLLRAWPQTTLHMVLWLLLASLWLTRELSGILPSALVIMFSSFPYLLWRSGYMLLSGQRGKAAATRFKDHLFYIWPVWDGTNTPAGKGHDYLATVEAKEPEKYARSVLAGVKLLCLVGLWSLASEVMRGAVYSDPRSVFTTWFAGYDLHLVRLKTILSGGIPVTIPTFWASLYAELVWDTLSLAAKGHTWVGIIRLFGFNIFRNTYKPLLAESIVDFWNRYYYYFKELMVEFFFFPTYLSYFRQRPLLRIAAAVFAAAFFGNMYYHLLQAKTSLMNADGAALWQQFGPRLIYCFVLAAGIVVSMLRQQKRRGKGTIPLSMAITARIRRIAGVWTFFAIINLWNVSSAATIVDRCRFFLTMIGL